MPAHRPAIEMYKFRSTGPVLFGTLGQVRCKWRVPGKKQQTQQQWQVLSVTCRAVFTYPLERLIDSDKPTERN